MAGSGSKSERLLSRGWFAGGLTLIGLTPRLSTRNRQDTRELFAGEPRLEGPRNMLPLLALSLVLLLAFAISATAAPVQAAESTPSNASLNRSLASFPDSPLTINDSNIDSMLKLYSPLFIDFWEPRCYPCVLMNVTMDEIARDLKGKVAFGKLNIYDNPVSMKKFSVTRTPTLILFKNGTIIYKFIGYADRSMTEDRISTHL